MESLDAFLRELSESPEGRQFLSSRRLRLFRELHEIVFYGKGGYDWETVYHLPLWLRRFVYSEINKHYRDEKKAIEDAKNGKSQTIGKQQGSTIRKPDFTLKPRK